MGDVVAMRRDGVPTVPLCKNCESFRPHSGIGQPPYCCSPKRKGDFDPVYGWQEKWVRAHDARRDNNDCGTVGNFYEEKMYLGEDPLSLGSEPPKKPTYWSRFKRWLT